MGGLSLLIQTDPLCPFCRIHLITGDDLVVAKRLNGSFLKTKPTKKAAEHANEEKTLTPSGPPKFVKGVCANNTLPKAAEVLQLKQDISSGFPDVLPQLPVASMDPTSPSK